MASVGRLVVIDLSSSDDEDDETVCDGEDKKTVVRLATNPKNYSVVEVLTNEGKAREDDDCCILAFDPFDSLTADLSRSFYLENYHKFETGGDEDITILSARGKVALKDYPHSRHHCVEYPFNKTPHESCCAKCYCYVCDEVAPCVFWKADSAGHCHASDEEQKWRDLRLSTRVNLQKKEQNLPTKSKTIHPLPTAQVF